MTNFNFVKQQLEDEGITEEEYIKEYYNGDYNLFLEDIYSDNYPKSIVPFNQDLGHWLYSGPPFDPEDYFGFIYMITCSHPDEPKRYIGKKQFHMYRKGKERKVSNWKTYKSSSSHINKLISDLGEEYFTYEILQLFETKGGLSAGEVKVQWSLDVLTEKYPDGTPVFLNRQIGAIKFIPKESVDNETRKKLLGITNDIREEFKKQEASTNEKEEGVSTETKDGKEP